MHQYLPCEKVRIKIRSTDPGGSAIPVFKINVTRDPKVHESPTAHKVTIIGHLRKSHQESIASLIKLIQSYMIFT